VNGWLVPPGQPSKTADILFDFYTGKIKLDRPAGQLDLSRPRRDSLHVSPSLRRVPSLLPIIPPLPLKKRIGSLRSSSPETISGSDIEKEEPAPGLDPNNLADNFVNDIGAPYPAVHQDNSSPSEDFFTVGE
jgi:hypothetical protein